MALGCDPASRFKYRPPEGGTFDPYFIKGGFYMELEISRTDNFGRSGRLDGMRRQGTLPLALLGLFPPSLEEALLIRPTPQTCSGVVRNGVHLL